MNKKTKMKIFTTGLTLMACLGIPACKGMPEIRQGKAEAHKKISDAPSFSVVPNEKIKVELFLKKERKKDAKFIKQLFADQSIKRVMIQFFRAGNPPKNIVIGSAVPADVGRMIIELAIHYNQGITHLLPEFRFFPHYVAFGSSAFAIDAQVPISAKDLDRLRDESLSNEEFHQLFRSLTGEAEGDVSYID